MTIRKRRPGAIFMAAILLAAALPTAVAAASSTRVNSTPSSLPTWAHGSVIGAGPHNGVRLMLVAWPKGNFHVGQQVHLKVIGKTTSSPSGSYAIHTSVRLPKGIHNLEVLARSRVAIGAFSFSRQVTRRGRALVAVEGNAKPGPVTANIRMMALPKSAVSAIPHPGFPPACMVVPKKVREFGPRLVTIGGLYSIGIPHAKITMTYAEGATTTLGVEISVPLLKDSFTAGGTFTTSKTGTEGFPTQTGVEGSA
jgi:hypothetical protein